jgi:octaprenyl-diphosphate synthase
MMAELIAMPVYQVKATSNGLLPLPMNLEDALQLVEDKMYATVNSDVTVLRDASRHILTAGGKRLRPQMAILGFFAAGGKDVTPVIPVAAAVELVHTASVVHDDINDHGVVRRGRPSVNSLWGRTFALLTGDFLFTKVYELMAPYQDFNIILADATIALVEGETLQAAAVKDNNFSREVYYQIIARKTAALFQAAGELGGKMANGSLEVVQALKTFGFNVGLAFQIVDDVLDLVGDAEKLGKTSGIDVEQGRGFAVAHNGEAADALESIKQRALKGDAIEEAKKQAQNLVDLAISELRVLPESEAKQALIKLAQMSINREF